MVVYAFMGNVMLAGAGLSLAEGYPAVAAPMTAISFLAWVFVFALAR